MQPVKLSNKGVVARFRGLEPQLILKETNDAIRMDKGILEKHWPRVVQGLKQLRSGDCKAHTEKVDHVRILQAAMHWVSVFGANARVHINTYGDPCPLYSPKEYLTLAILPKSRRWQILIYHEQINSGSNSPILPKLGAGL